jgi:hypothetical protein
LPSHINLEEFSISSPERILSLFIDRWMDGWFCPLSFPFFFPFSGLHCSLPLYFLLVFVTFTFPFFFLWEEKDLSSDTGRLGSLGDSCIERMYPSEQTAACFPSNDNNLSKRCSRPGLLVAWDKPTVLFSGSGAWPINK